MLESRSEEIDTSSCFMRFSHGLFSIEREQGGKLGLSAPLLRHSPQAATDCGGAGMTALRRNIQRPSYAFHARLDYQRLDISFPIFHSFNTTKILAKLGKRKVSDGELPISLKRTMTVSYSCTCRPPAPDCLDQLEARSAPLPVERMFLPALPPYPQTCRVASSPRLCIYRQLRRYTSPRAHF